MSDNGPVLPNSPLERALNGYAVPELSADFADRVVARVEARPEPLPVPRRSSRGSLGWSRARKAVAGVAAFGMLATAAAATGLLEELSIEIPSAEEVWSSVTGGTGSGSPETDEMGGAGANLQPNAASTWEFDGAIDTPEELEAAFSQIDDLRARRQDTFRSRVDRFIDREIQRREARGLPTPTPEQEARLRDRIDSGIDRRAGSREGRIEERRERLREKVESGEPVTRQDLRPGADGSAIPPRMQQRMERLKEMSPEERREALRNFRERRQQRRADRAASSQEPAEADVPLSEIEDESAASIDQMPTDERTSSEE
ncbi:MAG: hypothetical protein AAGK02_06390 [Pseudomonadota bacterium]